MAASISIQPVIMAGGSGTRLWPLSRAGFPKQFLPLGGDDSLFQQAVARLTGLAGADIAVERAADRRQREHRFLVLEQLREMRRRARRRASSSRWAATPRRR